MKNLSRVLVIAMLSVPFVATADEPQEKTSSAETTEAKPEKLSQSDLNVMAHYRALDQHEIDLAKAAEKHAASDDVKAYAKMLVSDHSQNEQALTSLAKQRGQHIGAEKPSSDVEKQALAERKAVAKKLATLKGGEFDHAYLRTMVQEHQQALAQIDSDISKSHSPELAQLLRDTKPVLQTHEDRAREIQNTLNAPSASNTPPPAHRD